LTDTPESDLARYEFEMDAGELNPRDVKLRLANQVVTALHNGQAARQAESEFVRVFSRREMPDDMPSFSLDRPVMIVDLLAQIGLVRSKSEARRLIAQGGVRLDGHQIDDVRTVVDLVDQPINNDASEDGMILRVGRRRFVRLTFDHNSKGKNNIDESSCD
jgi:tyrosyl-tRNA synthetase